MLILIAIIIIIIIIIIMMMCLIPYETLYNTRQYYARAGPDVVMLSESLASRMRMMTADEGLRAPLASLHPVSVTRFPSFRTQTLENLSHYL